MRYVIGESRRGRGRLALGCQAETSGGLDRVDERYRFDETQSRGLSTAIGARFAKRETHRPVFALFLARVSSVHRLDVRATSMHVARDQSSESEMCPAGASRYELTDRC
ncbi:unnamed protein product [Lasius platythorax]|uniref:Uncharacterized protein n=1 Tax=Lasius platythorax TaxID=488582 RepID=A0AAV2NMM5_9HYME